MRVSKNTASVDSIFRIIRQKNNREIFEQKKRNKAVNRKITLFFWLALIPFVFSIILGFINKWFFKNKILFSISLISLLTSYLLMLLQPLVIAWFSRKAIFNFILSPFDYFLEKIKYITKIDYRYTNLLKNKDIAHLKFVKVIVSAEKRSIEKRISLIIGSIEKIGIFPGILATFTILTKTLNNIPKDVSDWIYAIAYINPAIYFIGVYIHSVLLRIDKAIDILDYVIGEKQKRL